jgi:hypothetical protein
MLRQTMKETISPRTLVHEIDFALPCQIVRSSPDDSPVATGVADIKEMR